MKEGQTLWTREELILALNLYLKLPFGKLDRRTPEVIQLAGLINRSANAVAMRLNNFASVDPFHQKRGIKGLEGGRKQVQPMGMNLWGIKMTCFLKVKEYLHKSKKLVWRKNLRMFWAD